jgi:RNA-directed DNA polymerase
VEAMEADGGERFLQQLQDALVTRTYRPMRGRQKAIPKEGGTKGRGRALPTLRARGVPGAVKLILAPLVEADCPPGSYGYRPKRSAHDAVLRGAEAMVQDKPRVIDGDVQAYGENIRPHLLLAHVAQRVNDPDVWQGRKRRRHAAGKQGGAQGGVRAPRRRKLSLTAVERRLERAKEGPRRGPYTSLEDARGADGTPVQA